MLGVGRGVLVGHWTNEEALTGCTVVVFPDGTAAPNSSSTPYQAA
ncbi:MAG: hypothetical protein OXT07_03035 [bacterium]|nr:hypothetical protein [bacterium]